MERLGSLPHELVLLVAEQAARSEVYSRKRWVAALCRVSRLFNRVVTPILYETIIFDQDNFQALGTLASSAKTPLQYTREVFFSCNFSINYSSADYEPCHADPFLAPLSKALQNVRAFTGELAIPEGLAHFNSRRRLSSVFITDGAYNWPPRSVMQCSLAAVSAAPRVHVIVSLYDAQFPLDVLSSLAADYLLITGIPHSITGMPDAFLRELEAVLRRASLQRLTVRLWEPYAGQAYGVMLEFTAWANDKRDPRIWLEDACVSSGKGGNATVDSWERADAMQGDDPWQIGQQLHVDR